MADNVTPLPGREQLPANPLQIVRDTNYCSHESLVLNEHFRSMSCAACGASLDAFDYLRLNAIHLRRAWDAHRTVSAQAAELAERVAELKRQEANLKSRIKRAQAPDVISTRGKP